MNLLQKEGGMALILWKSTMLYYLILCLFLQLYRIIAVF